MRAAEPNVRYDVFISYRRGAGDELALLLQRELQSIEITKELKGAASE
jgi:hypothetical protein